MFKAVQNLREGKGFTLIELLIVVAIIGILAAIAIPAYIGAQEKARKSNVQKAQASAESDVQHWLNSAFKGVSVSAPGARLTEVDTDWNGTVEAVNDLNNFDLFAGGPANAAVAGCYVAARTQGAGLGSRGDCGTAATVEEMSPWAGMDGCVPTQNLYGMSTAPAPPITSPSLTPCYVHMYASANSTASITLLASDNGPGGDTTGSSEELGRKMVTAE